MGWRIFLEMIASMELFMALMLAVRVRDRACVCEYGCAERERERERERAGEIERDREGLKKAEFNFHKSNLDRMGFIKCFRSKLEL